MDPATPPPPVAPSRRPRLREWPLGVVLAGVVGGLAAVAAGAFRPGGVLVGASVLVGAILRAALPERRAGLLVVRSRPLDVVILVAMGAGIVVLALVVPRR